VPDLDRVVLDPAGAGKALVMFALVECHDGAVRVEHYRTGGGRALIDGEDVHGAIFAEYLSRLGRNLPAVDESA
jgi:hypothetical protein